MTNNTGFDKLQLRLQLTIGDYSFALYRHSDKRFPLYDYMEVRDNCTKFLSGLVIKFRAPDRCIEVVSNAIGLVFKDRQLIDNLELRFDSDSGRCFFTYIGERIDRSLHQDILTALGNVDDYWYSILNKHIAEQTVGYGTIVYSDDLLPVSGEPEEKLPSVADFEKEELGEFKPLSNLDYENAYFVELTKHPKLKGLTIFEDEDLKEYDWAYKGSESDTYFASAKEAFIDFVSNALNGFQ
jgi:hypothetical protein